MSKRGETVCVDCRTVAETVHGTEWCQSCWDQRHRESEQMYWEGKRVDKWDCFTLVRPPHTRAIVTEWRGGWVYFRVPPGALNGHTTLLPQAQFMELYEPAGTTK